VRRRLARSKSTPAVVVAQIEALLARDDVGSVTIDGRPGSYEVTVHEWASKNHSHHGGVTLAEAVNRAAKAGQFTRVAPGEKP
jgi:hypothetical protein